MLGSPNVFDDRIRFIESLQGASADAETTRHHIIVQENDDDESTAKTKAFCRQYSADNGNFPTASIIDVEQLNNDGNTNINCQQEESPRKTEGSSGSFWGASTLPKSRKDLYTAYLFLIFTGWCGGHHLYLGRPGFFVLYLFSAGGLGIGLLVDMFTLPGQVARANDQDFPTADFLGLEIYVDYLAHKRFNAVQHTRAAIVDGRDQSENLDNCQLPTGCSIAPKVLPGLLNDCYSMWGLGFLGLHHFHLKNNFMGVCYLFTFGLFGVGWIADLFRMPILCNRVMASLEANAVMQPVSLDVAYTCWMPGGLLGLHHLYLGDIWSFLLYFCTLGCLGLGWVIDGFRMPQLVAHENERRRFHAQMFAPFAMAAMGCEEELPPPDRLSLSAPLMTSSAAGSAFERC
jgi:TM2 domain-containing membrane protein YozV